MGCGGYWVQRRFSFLLPVSLLTFVALTFLFGFTADPFKTPSYLGHQLREIFGTDLSVTMFLAMGVLIYLENKYDKGPGPQARGNEEYPKINLKRIIWWSVPAVCCSAFLIFKVLTLDIGNEIGRLGRTKNWSVLDLFAWHFFEHTLDYIFVVAVVYFLYLVLLKSEYEKADE